jgi:hypothetical protein
MKANAVVIACETSDEWLGVVRQILEPTGVKVTRFEFRETDLGDLNADLNTTKGEK